MKIRQLIPCTLLALLLGPSMACLADSSLQSKPDLTQLALETKEPVRFAVDPQRVVDLKGKEGTVLRFKPGSLVLKDGSAPTAKRVEVRLWEFYSCFDVLNAGLVTQSGKRILETAGMIYVEADSDGQPLRLAEGTSMDVSMPSPEGMSLFRGIEKEGVIDWQLPGALDPRPDKRNPLLSTDQRLVRTPRSERYLKELASRTAASRQGGRFDLKEYFSGELGWINCDKFSQQERTEYEVVIDRAQLPKRNGDVVNKEEAPNAAAALLGLDDERVVAIFTGTRGVISATRKDADRYLVSVPKGEPIILVAINQNNGANQLYAGLSPTIGGNISGVRRGANDLENSVSIELGPSSKDDLQRATSRLW